MPLLRSHPDPALQSKAEEDCAALLFELEQADRARQLRLLYNPRLERLRAPLGEAAARAAWEARLAAQLRTILRASIAEHWPDAASASSSSSSSSSRSEVPRAAARLAQAITSAVELRFEPNGGGGGGGEATPGAEQLEQAVGELVRERDVLLLLRLAPPQAQAQAAAAAAAAGGALVVSADALVAHVAEQLLLAAEKPLRGVRFGDEGTFA